MSVTTKLEVTHLTREIKTALELAIAGFAPNEVIDKLAVVAGLLDALNSLALDQNATPLFITTIDRGNIALIGWNNWRSIHSPPRA